MQEHSKNHKTYPPLPDQAQTYWQLASIQIAAFGLPSLYFGAYLEKGQGAATAVLSICVGNLILWLVGLATIAMTVKKRKNAIENLRTYIGKVGCLIGGITLSFAFLFWFTIQITSTVTEMKKVLNAYLNLSEVFNIRVGAALGIFISLLSIGGIRLIKWFNVLLLPFLIGYIIYAIVANQSWTHLNGSLEISFPIVISSIIITLPGVVNLPTFFRHRREPIDAFLALSLFIFFTALIESSAIFLINQSTGEYFSSYLNTGPVQAVFLLLFMIISLISANLVNVYFASAAWEESFPWISRSKEFAIIGMAGTVMFTFFQSQTVMVYLERLLSSFIANLGIVIIMAYLVQRIVVHRQRKFELLISFICWLIGCIATTFIQDIDLKHATQAFAFGLGASVLFYLLFLFLEETMWSLKKVVFHK